MYRVQNHALDLKVLGSEDALLIQVDEKNSTSCIHVPRQISKSDLVQLLPNSWITDYEQLHTQANEPLESSNSKITKTIEGRTSISFDHSHLKSSIKTLPSIMLAELPLKLPTQEEKLWGCYEENCQKGFLQDIIDHFNDNGEPIYHFQDPISGHIYFDTCTRCEECYWAEQLELDASEISLKKKSKPADPQPFEPRPCKPDPKPQDPGTDNFQTARSTFDGYQIPSSWVYKKPRKEKILHPYYQQCLDILEKEARAKTKKIQKETKPINILPQSPKISSRLFHVSCFKKLISHLWNHLLKMVLNIPQKSKMLLLLFYQLENLLLQIFLMKFSTGRQKTPWYRIQLLPLFIKMSQRYLNR